MSINPLPFHSPPPSFAMLFVTEPPLIVTFAGPVICKPPPLPGEVPALLLVKVMLLNVEVVVDPTFISIPPPALFEVFPDIVIPLILRIPFKFKIPPPEPSVPPDAKLLEIVELPFTVSVPPLLKIPPPPSSAATLPLASLPFIILLVTVIFPVLFQSPPPSKAAILLITELPVRISPEVPER